MYLNRFQESTYKSSVQKQNNSTTGQFGANLERFGTACLCLQIVSNHQTSYIFKGLKRNVWNKLILKDDCGTQNITVHLPFLSLPLPVFDGDLLVPNFDFLFHISICVVLDLKKWTQKEDE